MGHQFVNRSYVILGVSKRLRRSHSDPNLFSLTCTLRFCSCFHSQRWLSIVYTRRNIDTARIFPSGRSQSVRLPKEYRFKGKDIMIKHFDNGVLLLPIDTSWTMLQAALQEFEPGFILKREQPEEQRREEIAAYFPLSG